MALVPGKIGPLSPQRNENTDTEIYCQGRGQGAAEGPGNVIMTPHDVRAAAQATDCGS